MNLKLPPADVQGLAAWWPKLEAFDDICQRRKRIADLRRYGVEPEHLAERFGMPLSRVREILKSEGA